MAPPGWWKVVVRMLHQVAKVNVKSTVYTMLAVRKEVMVSDCCNLLNSCRTRDGGARGINLLPPPDLVVSAPWAASDHGKYVVSCLRGQTKTSKIRGFAPWRLQQPAKIIRFGAKMPQDGSKMPQDGYMRPQDASKMASRGSDFAPRGSEMPQYCLKRPSDGSKIAPRGCKIHPR